MQPRELIGTAIVPGGESLRLFRRGGTNGKGLRHVIRFATKG